MNIEKRALDKSINRMNEIKTCSLSFSFVLKMFLTKEKKSSLDELIRFFEHVSFPKIGKGYSFHKKDIL